MAAFSGCISGPGDWHGRERERERERGCLCPDNSIPETREAETDLIGKGREWRVLVMGMAGE